MPARVLDGKALAERVRGEVRDEAQALERRGVRPNLQVVLVGDDPASAVYVRNKTKAAEECGIQGDTHRLPATAPEADVLGIVDKLARDPAVHGILVQLPLPKHLDEERVLLRVPARKDVDGFHPENLGRLLAGKPRFEPCTPAGVVALLAANDVPIPGAHVVILGRGPTVGRPLSVMLSQKGPRADATVTLCHSQTKHLHMQARVADILVAAMGKARFVQPQMVKRGAAVVDVGINRVLDPTHPKGERVVGDVDPAVAELAGWLSPVPGGVGPMTIAMLLRNTVRAAGLQPG
ncbi:MAG: bifunctional 5,10-methylenetetrahydrofolate dehydrogenase/5,10-methenyltetrahydrofolate cyclohydrolase [Halobacteriales archaeon]|nr:bifunctional 5,10-methylenetetrahydrofolate dehydrogenase/5,10-methenyltetrahydrofolate cyclohydrolase [Halobacteriales archaeon]